MSTVTIPESHRYLLEKPQVMTLVTLMPDGQPQATVVWFTYDGAHIWVNTALDSQKGKNMANDRRVTLMLIDFENPSRYLEIRGVVQEINEADALSHLGEVAERYTGKRDLAEGNELTKQKRAIFKIQPLKTIVL